MRETIKAGAEIDFMTPKEMKEALDEQARKFDRLLSEGVSYIRVTVQSGPDNFCEFRAPMGYAWAIQSLSIAAFTTSTCDHTLFWNKNMYQGAIIYQQSPAISGTSFTYFTFGSTGMVLLSTQSLYTLTFTTSGAISVPAVANAIVKQVPSNALGKL